MRNNVIDFQPKETKKINKKKSKNITQIKKKMSESKF